MRILPRSRSGVLTVSLLAGLAFVTLALVYRATRAAEPPIVLGYRDTPILLGPHEHWVTSIAFSPDGKTLATGAADGYLRFWDVASGKLHGMRGDDGTRGMHGLAFAPDGSRVAVVGGMLDKEVVFYETTAPALATPFAARSASFDWPRPFPATSPFVYQGKPAEFRVLTAIDYSPDGRWVASAPDNVVVRDANNGTILVSLPHPAKGVKAVAFAADGKTLVTAGQDRKVRWWSLPEGKLMSSMGVAQPVVALAVSPGGKRYAAISAGAPLFSSKPVATLWVGAQPGQSAQQVVLPRCSAAQLVFAGDDRLFVAAGRDVMSFDLAAPSIESHMVASSNEDLLTLALSPDGQVLAFGGRDRSVDLVEAATGKLLKRLPGTISRYSALAHSKDGKLFATATIDARFSNVVPERDQMFLERYRKYFYDSGNVSRIQPGEVRIWSAEDGRMLHVLPLEDSQVTALAFVPGTAELLVVGWSPDKRRGVSRWDAREGTLLSPGDSSGYAITELAVSPDGTQRVTGTERGLLEWRELRTNKTTNMAEPGSGPINAITFSDDGKVLATANNGFYVRVWSADGSATLHNFKCPSHIESLDFSPDGNLLAAGTRAKGLYIWDLRTGGAGQTWSADGDYVETMPGFVAFSPDGRRVACGGHGKDIAVFNVDSGQLECELSGHEHPPTAAVFLSNDRLVSGGEEGAIRLWDVSQRATLAIWYTVSADPTRNWQDEWVGFTPKGKFITSPASDRFVGWQHNGQLIIGDAGPGVTRVESLFAPAQAAVRK